MSLFVGRLSSDTRSRDLEDLFYKFGKITRCDVKRGGFGFVEFEDKRDAEDAIKELDGATLLGRRIAVEWAKGPRRGSDSSSSRDKTDGDACFKCGESGHWARDCTNSRSGGSSRRRSRSRSPRRRRSSRERERSPRRGSRSPPRRDRERDRSPKRDRSPRRSSPRRSSRSPKRSPKDSPRESPRSPKKESPREDKEPVSPRD